MGKRGSTRSRGAGEKEDAGTRERADAGSCGTHRSPHGDLKGSREPRTPCPCLRVIPSPRQSRRDFPHLEHLEHLELLRPSVQKPATFNPLSHHHAAIDMENLPGDVGGCGIGCEEANHASYFFGLSVAG